MENHGALIKYQEINFYIIKLFSVFFILYSLGFISGAECSSTKMKNFNFHDYDKLEEKDEKISAAQMDIRIAFPPNSPTKNLEDYFYSRNGYCKKRDYIPTQDRMSIRGDQIYCELTYPYPGHIFSIIRVKWVVDIKYQKETELIQELKVFWEPYGIGG